MSKAATPQRYAPDDPREWLRLARQDLAFARSRIPDAPDFELHCYHAQQAAEKALKAVCIARGIVFPYTHLIGRLLKALAAKGVEVPDSLKAARHLSRYATAGRYPSERVLDADAHRKAVAHAATVLDWAATQMADEAPGVREPMRRYSNVPRGQRQPEPRLLNDVVARIVAVAAPECIILFGSGARGTMRPGSDLDLMVVTRQGDASGELDAAIRTSLEELDFDTDIVIVTPDQLERYGGSIGLVYRPALEEGRVIYGATTARVDTT